MINHVQNRDICISSDRWSCCRSSSPRAASPWFLASLHLGCSPGLGLGFLWSFMSGALQTGSNSLQTWHLLPCGWPGMPADGSGVWQGRAQPRSSTAAASRDTHIPRVHLLYQKEKLWLNLILFKGQAINVWERVISFPRALVHLLFLFRPPSSISVTSTPFPLSLVPTESKSRHRKQEL